MTRDSEAKKDVIVSGIPQRMRESRRRANVVQKVAAERTEVSESAYKGYEIGHRIPSVHFLVRFALSLNVDPAWLILGDTGLAMERLPVLVETVALSVARRTLDETGAQIEPERLARIARYAYETSVAKDTDFATEFARIVDLSGP